MLAACASNGAQPPQLTQVGGTGQATSSTASSSAAQLLEQPSTPSAPTTTAAIGTSSVATAGSGPTIVGFKSKTVVLYDSRGSQNGVRVPVASLRTPIRVTSTAGSRIPIKTVSGTSWVSRSDVVIN